MSKRPNSYLLIAETVDKIIRRARRYNTIKRWNTLMFLERDLKWMLRAVRKEYRPLREMVEAEVKRMSEKRGR